MKLPFVYCLIAVAGLGFGLPSSRCFGCRCAPVPIEAAWNDASAIFQGTADKIVSTDDGTAHTITFTVDRAWKGVDPKDSRVTVTTCGNSACCGYNFEVGTAYLVYTVGNRDDLSVTTCSRTRPMSDDQAMTDITALATLQGDTNPVTVSSTPAPAKLTVAETKALEALGRMMANAYIQNDELSFQALILPADKMGQVLTGEWKERDPSEVYQMLVDGNLHRFREIRTRRDNWSALRFEQISPGYPYQDERVYAPGVVALKNSAVVRVDSDGEQVRLKIEDVVFVGDRCYLVKLD